MKLNDSETRVFGLDLGSVVKLLMGLEIYLRQHEDNLTREELEEAIELFTALESRYSELGGKAKPMILPKVGN